MAPCMKTDTHVLGYRTTDELNFGYYPCRSHLVRSTEVNHQRHDSPETHSKCTNHLLLYLCNTNNTNSNENKQQMDPCYKMY